MVTKMVSKLFEQPSHFRSYESVVSASRPDSSASGDTEVFSPFFFLLNRLFFDPESDFDFDFEDMFAAIWGNRNPGGKQASRAQAMRSMLQGC